MLEQGRLDEAIREFNSAIASAPDRAEAHYLKAIYLDPQHDEALLALALLARRKGDVAAEAAYRARAGRATRRLSAVQTWRRFPPLT